MSKNYFLIPRDTPLGRRIEELLRARLTAIRRARALVKTVGGTSWRSWDGFWFGGVRTIYLDYGNVTSDWLLDHRGGFYPNRGTARGAEIAKEIEAIGRIPWLALNELVNLTTIMSGGQVRIVGTLDSPAHEHYGLEITDWALSRPGITIPDYAVRVDVQEYEKATGRVGVQ